MSEIEFDPWAIKTNWEGKLWIVRLWLTIIGRKPNLCQHDYVVGSRTKVENGKKRYYRQHTFTFRVCPLCGDEKEVRVSTTAWKKSTDSGFFAG